MAKAELSPKAESELVVTALREKSGLDPAVLREVVPVWSIGLTNGVWRNTVIEDWHSGTSPLTDGDMLRINSHTTYGVQKRLNGWLRTHELEVDGATSELDDVDLDDVEELAVLLYAWLTRPQRRLPTGMTLAQLAESVGGGIEEYAEDADEALSGFLAMAEESGPAFAFLRTAAHGALACAHWWNHPRWPAHVDAFMAELRDPANKYVQRLGSRPAEIEDLAVLRSQLLSAPWKLSGESAEWLVDAGLRYAKP